MGMMMTLQHHVLPEQRRAYLRSRLQSGANLRLIEAHSGLSALVAADAKLADSANGSTQFDGIWISSLTSSAARGLPDMEMYILERRLELVEEVSHVSDRAIVVDGDTGGDASTFEYLCARLEAMGISCVVIEDKQHPKRNSLSSKSSHLLEDPLVFAAKIRRAKAVLKSADFLIFARLESLIAGNSVDDALERAAIYLAAGVDGIMIHSKSASPDAIFEFLTRYHAMNAGTGLQRPVMCVPTTYNMVTARELFERGVRIVVHANHLLRASHFAMRQVCEEILRHDRSLEVDNVCTPVSEIFNAVGYDAALARERLNGTAI
jgi:phosphoenolpyruvate phosphomutase